MPISRSWMCKCGKEFESKEALILHRANHSSEEKVSPLRPDIPERTTQPVVQQPQPAQPKQIKLKYVYEGQCPTCAGVIQTIELGVKDSYYCIAYCARCSKQLEEREVVKL